MRRRPPSRANPRLSVNGLRGMLATREALARSGATDGILTSSGLHVRQPRVAPRVLGNIFAVLVWQDGGATDGTAAAQCDRTYDVRTIDATAHDTGGIELGTGMTPLKVRPTTGKMLVAAAAGAGVVGLGYYDDANAFALYDANESLDTDACP